MKNLAEVDKQFLLKIARDSLEYFFETGNMLSIDTLEAPKHLEKPRATFVTLTIKGELRGCIGKLLPQNGLAKDVVENAFDAAFGDPRFPPLTRGELTKTSIEISILDRPKAFKYSDTKDLLQQLERKKPGVILKYGMQSATFLPQVWEELPIAEDFLSHLCQKAGLTGDFWKTKKVKIKTYKVISFSEKREVK